MKEPVNRIALIDLDGTVADYDAAMLRDLNAIRCPHEPEETIPHRSDEPHMKARAKMIRSQPGWWFNLVPLKKGFDVIGLLKKYEFGLHVLTKAPNSVDEAWTEKIKWCKKYLPGVDITISQDKGLVYGKVLVDDWPPYVMDWLKHRPRGLVIMVEQRWNKDFNHPQVIKYNGTNLDEIDARLKKIVDAEEYAKIALEYGLPA